MRHLTWPDEISRTLGAILRGQQELIDRELINDVVATVHYELENNYDLYRNDRDPDDPDLFVYPLLAVASDSRWYKLAFSVDDCVGTDYLLIAAVTEIKRGRLPPFPPHESNN